MCGSDQLVIYIEIVDLGNWKASAIDAQLLVRDPKLNEMYKPSTPVTPAQAARLLLEGLKGDYTTATEECHPSTDVGD
jgi:hypothetical protein